jgi:hypothetical protein
LSSRRTSRHRPRHAAGRQPGSGNASSHRAGHSHRRKATFGIPGITGITGNGSPSRLTLGIVAASAAGAAAVAGISVGVSVGAVPQQPRQLSAGSLAAAPGLTAAGRYRTGHGTADSGGSAEPDRSNTQSSRGKPRQSASSALAKTGKAAAHQSAAAHATARSKPAKPYIFYDSTEPQAVPAGAEVATYATGARPVPTSAVAGRKNVLWIDTLGTDPSAQALDVEPGCASPSQVPGWISAKLKAHPHELAIIYTTLSEWSEVQADVASLPSSMRSQIRWWIADPTGTPHMVPGAQATQYYWGSSYDISLAEPDF